MSKPRKTNWENLDWRLPNAILAKRHGVDGKLVSKWRKKLSVLKSFHPSRKIKTFVVFEKTNKELSLEHGISRKYVSNLRKKWGAPPSPDCNKLSPAHTRDWSYVDWAQPVRRIAKRMVCSPSTVSRMRKVLGLPKKAHHLNP